jgi:endonuclease YncB( thermonuclease family)
LRNICGSLLRDRATALLSRRPSGRRSSRDQRVARVRIDGINAPELSTQAGKEARDFAQTLLAPGDALEVLSYGWDKYGGRIDGSANLPGGRDFAQVMLDTAHAKPYTGVGPKPT